MNTRNKDKIRLMQTLCCILIHINMLHTTHIFQNTCTIGLIYAFFTIFKEAFKLKGMEYLINAFAQKKKAQRFLFNYHG